MNKIALRTGIWYNDHQIELSFPEEWAVTTFWPDVPPPLSHDEIRGRLTAQVNRPPLREQVKGAGKPVVVIDDLARPTPVGKVMPFLLEEFGAAGIAPGEVTIVVATGTHGRQGEAGLVNKIGREAFETCRIVVHDYKKNLRRVGTTSYGTPVLVNREVLAADFLCGIGGIYPQHTTGFGGGSKLALGVLGRKSIVHLHFGGHRSVGGTYNIDNSFRRDLDEIAAMIGFDTMITLHIDADSAIVNLTAGDHFAYYQEAAAFSRNAYDAPLPLDADAVIANTYPSDVSYTFMRKGMKPLRCAPAGAVKVAVGSNYEGLGEHGIFPQGGSSRLERLRALRLRISTMTPKVIAGKIVKNIFRRSGGPGSPGGSTPHQGVSGLAEKIDDLILYRPAGAEVPIPAIDGMRISRSWEEVVEAIRSRHPGKQRPKIYIYPCGSLQCLDHTQMTTQMTTQMNTQIDTQLNTRPNTMPNTTPQSAGKTAPDAAPGG